MTALHAAPPAGAAEAPVPSIGAVSGENGCRSAAASAAGRSRPGPYQATFTATDSAGASPSKTLSFTIVSR